MFNRGIGNPDYFETHYLGRDWRHYEEILSKIILFSEPGPILDIGAGLGYLVEGATRWGLDCSGIEGSEDAVRLAMRRCPTIRMRVHALSDALPFPVASRTRRNHEECSLPFRARG